LDIPSPKKDHLFVTLFYELCIVIIKQG